MSKTLFHISMGLSFAAAIGWMVVLFVPYGWQMKDFVAVVQLELGLLSMTIRRELLGHALSHGLSRVMPSKVAKVIKHWDEGSIWLTEAKDRFCTPLTGGTASEACSLMSRVLFASWAMLFFGLMAVIFLLNGCAFAYYYTQVRATETGRYWIRVFFMLAPAIAFLGLLQYLVLTLDFGSLGFGDPHFTFGITYASAWFLTIISGVPIILMSTAKRDALEKPAGMGELYEDDIYASLFTGFGSAPGGGYGAMGGYMGQSFPPPLQQAAAGPGWGGAPCAQQPAPGFGMSPQQPGPGFGMGFAGQPGVGQPGMAQPGMAQPGMAQPGMAQPGMAQPGMAQPGMGIGQPAAPIVSGWQTGAHWQQPQQQQHQPQLQQQQFQQQHSPEAVAAAEAAMNRALGVAQQVPQQQHGGQHRPSQFVYGTSQPAGQAVKWWT